jgi:preprotein translocase subunit SecG
LPVWWYIPLIIVHVFVAVSLILIVLLQAGKGAALGAAFGGASQTVFGPRGPGSFLGKLTTGAAGIFMITSLVLAIFSSQHIGGSVVLSGTSPQPTTAPVTVAPPAEEPKEPMPHAPESAPGSRETPSHTEGTGATHQ